jgi:hypothetical protein
VHLTSMEDPVDVRDQRRTSNDRPGTPFQHRASDQIAAIKVTAWRMHHV